MTHGKISIHDDMYGVLKLPLVLNDYYNRMFRKFHVNYENNFRLCDNSVNCFKVKL